MNSKTFIEFSRERISVTSKDKGRTIIISSKLIRNIISKIIFGVFFE